MHRLVLGSSLAALPGARRLSSRKSPALFDSSGRRLKINHRRFTAPTLTGRYTAVDDDEMRAAKMAAQGD